jgi:excisionase family DNA binding protein
MLPKPSKLLGLREIEEEFGLPYHTTYELIAKGVIPSIRVPGLRRIFVKRLDLERAIESWTERNAA